MKNLMILVLAVSAVIGEKPNCSYENLLACGTLESLIAEENWPHELDDASKIGERMIEGFECVRAFNKVCFNNSVTNRIADKIVDGLVNFFNDNCSDDGEKKDFLNLTIQCYNKASVASKLFEVNKRFVGLVEKLLTYPKKVQLPGYCCAALYLDSGVTDLPVEDCKQIYKDQLSRDLKGIFLTPFQKVCSEVVNFSYRHCLDTNLNDAQKNEFLSIINADRPPYTKYTTVLPTLYHVMDKN